MVQNFFKRIFYYVAAATCIITGALAITYYVTKPISFISVLVGIVGFMLIEPAVTLYANKIKDFFENE
jgi:hypothetical protein